MKNQALFSSKDKSKNLKCCLLQFLFGALRVNFYNTLYQCYNGTQCQMLLFKSVKCHFTIFQNFFFFCASNYIELEIQLFLAMILGQFFAISFKNKQKQSIVAPH